MSNTSGAGRNPFPIDVIDRIPKQRYYDPEFFALEVEHLWSRVWQMACRLEEIPNPDDYTEYRLLDQSVVVVRGADGSVHAFQNACRHRGVQVAQGRGNCGGRFTCPFHGWRYGADGKNLAVTQRRAFSEHNLAEGELDLTPVRCETWGGCAWINFDASAPPVRECLEPVAGVLEAWKLDQMRAEWWYACRLPVNWKLAEEAFVEQYHVIQSHPQLVIPGRYPPRDGGPLDTDVFMEAELHYLRTMSEGMAGMVHAKDVRIAEAMRATIELPAEPKAGMTAWNRSLNQAVVDWHRQAGTDIPDLNELEDNGLNQPMSYCFPHFFVLPMYSSASSYRFRPLGPEETLMEIWSLSRYPQGEEPPVPPTPEWWDHDDPRFPPIPRQDFSNLPKQQRGLHARGFEYMRLSPEIEGHISNYHRVIDGYLAGRPHDELLAALHGVNLNPLETPAVEATFR